MSDKDTSQEVLVDLHPIQLQFVAVRRLLVETYRPLSPDYEVPQEEIHVESASTQYDPEKKVLQVALRVHVGGEEEPTPDDTGRMTEPEAVPLRMDVRLVGQYLVDEARFPLEMLGEWTEKAGAMTLMPYAREQVFALTARCGIKPTILPLYQVKTIRLGAETPSRA